MDIDVQQVALYDVERILLCLRNKAWSSVPAYAKHLSLLCMFQAIKEERESYGQIDPPWVIIE